MIGGPTGEAACLFEALRGGGKRQDGPAMTFLSPELAPRRYTFSQLFDRVEATAARLERLGLPAASSVGILVHSQESQVIHYLAALARGLVPAILTPPSRKLDPHQYATTMATVLASCRFGAIITALTDIRTTSMRVEPDTLRLLQRGTSRPDDSGVPAAFVQFSSGTTGIKRGVPVTARAALSQIATYARAISLDRNDCILSWLPLYHDMGFVTSLNMALACGVHSIMMQPLDWVADPSMYVRAASAYRATLGWHPNFAFSLMADRADPRESVHLDLSSVRGLVNCSEPVTYTSQERFRSQFSRCGLRDDVFWGCYAMAETVFALTHGTSAEPGYLDTAGPDGPAARQRDGAPFVSVGRPLPGVELQIATPDGRVCEDRSIGEIRVRCPFLFSGYHHDPDGTRAAFSDGWYRTGDLGYSADGRYYVCGRTRDVIIVGGVNLHPSDVEDVASAVGGVHAGRVAAFGTFDLDTQSERVIVLAEVEREAAQPRVAAAIRAALASAFQLTAFEVHIVASGWLVKSSSGKMARKANREKWAEETAAPKLARS